MPFCWLRYIPQPHFFRRYRYSLATITTIIITRVNQSVVRILAIPSPRIAATTTTLFSVTTTPTLSSLVATHAQQRHYRCSLHLWLCHHSARSYPCIAMRNMRASSLAILAHPPTPIVVVSGFAPHPHWLNILGIG